MNWILPGTVLSADRGSSEQVDALFASMFLPGDMALGQVSNLTGLEPYIIQNWVKRGFLSPPKNKRYSQRQLCRILNINMLKSVLPMDRICGLLTYINGTLDDESDDMIDDSELYFMFIRLAGRAMDIDRNKSWLPAVDEVLSNFQETVPGAKDRVKQVLRIMLTAYIAAKMKDEAENLLAGIEAAP